MLNIVSDETEVPHGEFFAIMSMLRRNYVDREHMLDLLEVDKATISALKRLALEYMNFHSDRTYTDFNRNILRTFLIKDEKVPERYMQKYDVKKDRYVNSMDIIIINRLIEYNVSPYLMEIYVQIQELESKYNFARAQVGSLITTKLRSRTGKPLHAMPFYYTMQSTGRIYTSSVSLQSFSHRYDTISTAPEDYFLVWGDFSQIDLRVALELCLTGEGSLRENLDRHEDKYEAFSRAMHKDRSNVFNLEEFKEDREKYKEGILAPIYGMGVRAVQEKVGDVEIGSGIHGYINSNQKYKDYANNVQSNIDSGIDYYCETYFGSRMPIAQGTRNKQTASLNKPIQGTSSDIMKIVTVEIYRRMYSKTGDKNMFIPLVNRHDETIFLVHNSMRKHMHEFVDCARIQIDDWSVLDIEWGAGYVYGEEDEEVMADIQKSVRDNDLTPRKVTRRNKRYNATPKLVRFNWIIHEYGNIKFSLIQSFDTKKALFTVHRNRVDKAKIYSLIKEKWAKEVNNADRIVFASNRRGYEVFEDKEFIMNSNSRVSNYITDKLCKGLSARYIKNVLGSEPSVQWVEEGDLSLRKGFDLECLTEIL